MAKPDNVTFNEVNKTYRAITEQGDLGLGAQILNEADQEKMKDQEKKDNQ